MYDWYFKDYVSGFDELNELTAYVYRENASSTESLQTKYENILDNVLSFLILAYQAGIEAVNRMLWDITVDEDAMYDAIYLEIDGKTYEDRVKEYVVNNDLSGLQRLVSSEYHRIFNTAMYDGAKQYEEARNKERSRRGRDSMISPFRSTRISKEWVTMADERVRDTHRYLEGTKVGLDEKFYTYDGDSALYPGGFDKAENNVNCRCVVIYSTD